MTDTQAAERIWTDGHDYWAHPTHKDDKTEYIRADLVAAMKAENQRLREALDPDNLAQIIRAVDGGNRLGAGSLAEKISAVLRGTETSHG